MGQNINAYTQSTNAETLRKKVIQNIINECIKNNLKFKMDKDCIIIHKNITENE